MGRLSSFGSVVFPTLSELILGESFVEFGRAMGGPGLHADNAEMAEETWIRTKSLTPLFKCIV